MIGAFICGLSAVTLSREEADFLSRYRPWGVIFFRRNIDNPGQVRALSDAVRECLGREDAPILVDQEGGRVQRLGPPHWPAYPPAASYLARRQGNVAAAAADAAALARLMAADMADVGISVDCVPVLDVPQPGAHDIIGDRAYADGPDAVADLATAVISGLRAGGVLPVVKHIPGHGRAGCDSHAGVPVVEASREDLERVDFAPFRALNDQPMAMSAHVVYRAIDPHRPATVSKAVIEQVIRGDIGFDGLVMSDDLSMGALSGTLAQRTRAAIGAGIDVALHCNGRIGEMVEVAEAAGGLAGKALARAEAALAQRSPPQPFAQPATERLRQAYTGGR